MDTKRFCKQMNERLIHSFIINVLFKIYIVTFRYMFVFTLLKYLTNCDKEKQNGYS